ncbi:hypothetical protein HAX54_028422 [Datura stramonium]|uniref:Uncharacterized protein n=1 Tax=Datura stramonium TaxID=4076 RepID=A0ABS8V475_DATST|nr:hypothetical protein [Datura stramonium]
MKVVQYDIVDVLWRVKGFRNPLNMSACNEYLGNKMSSTDPKDVVVITVNIQCILPPTATDVCPVIPEVNDNEFDFGDNTYLPGLNTGLSRSSFVQQDASDSDIHSNHGLIEDDHSLDNEDVVNVEGSHMKTSIIILLLFHIWTPLEESVKHFACMRYGPARTAFRDSQNLKLLDGRKSPTSLPIGKLLWIVLPKYVIVKRERQVVPRDREQRLWKGWWYQEVDAKLIIT